MYAPEEVQDFEEKPRVMRDITPMTTTTYAGAEPVALVDMVDDEVDVNTLKLYVPNQDEPYAKYLNIKDWQMGFLDMARRIYTSPKFDEATRIEKYTALKVANKEYMDTWDSMQTAELLGGLNRLNKELNNG
jgi:inorganic pyrophosphatase